MSESKEQRRVTLQVHLGLIEEQIKHLLDLDSQLTNPEEQKDTLEQVKSYAKNKSRSDTSSSLLRSSHEPHRRSQDICDRRAVASLRSQRTAGREPRAESLRFTEEKTLSINARRR